MGLELTWRGEDATRYGVDTRRVAMIRKDVTRNRAA